MKATYRMDGAGHGWARIETADLPGPLFLRLEKDARGRFRVRDMVMRGTWRPLVGADPRELNLAGIEEWLQVDADLFCHGDPADDESLRWFEEGWGSLTDFSNHERRQVEPLQRPRNGLTDAFLTHVRDAYLQAVAEGLPPAPTLAAQVGDGATARTVHKWVATARQRGIMGPAARRRG